MKLTRMSHKTLKAEIVEIKDEAEDIKSFFIRPDEELEFLPGQFFTLSLCGVGEAPFSVASAPHEGLLRFTIRKTGKVTSALHRLKAGDILGIRGPYGNGFPLDPGGTAVIVGGGIGMAPVRSLLFHLQEKGIYDLWAFNGARSPRHILYVDELLGIKGRTKIILTVDRATPGWKYNEGVITMPMEKYLPKIERGTAYLCGPSVMFKYAVKTLLDKGFREENIYLSLEAHMKCAFGICGHCRIEDKFVCVDGPVFSYAEIKDYEEFLA